MAEAHCPVSLPGPDVLPVPRSAVAAAGSPFDGPWPILESAGVICASLSLPDDAALWQVWWRRALQATLPQEQARAAAFVHEADRLRHLAGRALLRKVAARYAGVSPWAPLSLQSHGKPYWSGSGIDVSISHAGDQVWVAIALAGQVGIDVEVSPGAQALREVAPGFHGAEVASLACLADPSPAILRVWTRKEAVAKATGLGLSLPLDSYAVAVESRAHDWLRLPPCGTPREAWTTQDLPSPPGYSASLAWQGGQGRVVCLQWTDAA